MATKKSTTTTKKKAGSKAKKATPAPSKGYEFVFSNDPKQEKFLDKIQKLLTELGSVHRVATVNTLLSEVERLEVLLRHHESQANVLGIVIGTAKGTKLYDKLSKATQVAEVPTTKTRAKKEKKV